MARSKVENLLLLRTLKSLAFSTGGRIKSRESSVLEFKKSFDWGSKSRYAKTVAAFANNKGGAIVFGVEDETQEMVGLRSENFTKFDEEKISGYLNSIFSQEVLFEKKTITLKGVKLGILLVHEALEKPIIVTKSDGEIFESDIYYRYIGRSEKIKYPQLGSILVSIKENERRGWMEHFKKISSIGPENSAVVDFLNGNISAGGSTVVISEKLLPKLKFIKQGKFRKGGKPTLRLIGDVVAAPVVMSRGISKMQVTNDPTAPKFQLSEENYKRFFPNDYDALVEKLKNKFPKFKRDKKFIGILRDIKKDRSLTYIRYLNPDNPKSAKQFYYSDKSIKKIGDLL